MICCFRQNNISSVFSLPHSPLAHVSTHVLLPIAHGRGMCAFPAALSTLPPSAPTFTHARASYPLPCPYKLLSLLSHRLASCPGHRNKKNENNKKQPTEIKQTRQQQRTTNENKTASKLQHALHGLIIKTRDGTKPDTAVLPGQPP